MSDEQRGQGPQAPGPPAYPAQQPYPGRQACPPETPYPGQPPVPQPPKSRPGVVIALVTVGVLLLCGIAGVAALLAAGALRGGGERGAVTQAERHFAAASSAVQTASATFEAANAGADPKKTAAAVGPAEESLRVARDEIASARRAILRVRASQGRADYLAALDAAAEGVRSLEDVVAYFRVMSSMASRVQEAVRAGSKANDDLNAAISAGNANRYGEMRTKALAASAGYVAAAAIFREASGLDRQAGLDKAVLFAERRKAQADVVARMADEGKAGRISAYNRDVQLQKRLGELAESIGDPPIMRDPKWLENRLADLEQSVGAAGERADRLRAKALEELGAGR